MARRVCTRRARSVSVVQRLQTRLSRAGRHGDVQGRVPLALLRGTAETEVRVRIGVDLLVGAGGVTHAGHHEFLHPDARTEESGEIRGRLLAEARNPAVCAADVQAVV